MNKKQSKRQRDIKTKLIAAICMLLVSSIMMVSTTYAWFTLSTAPEVTGINTAVGANGNLEMALQPLDGDSSKITSGTADSMAVKPIKESNVTWGNLVKLDGTGDNSYGLEGISLYPSALNVNTVTTGEGEAAKTVSSIKVSPLSTPEYGADGRVSNLRENTITGTYTNGAFYEKQQVNGAAASAYGVRAIGVASGMTPRNLAFRQALSNANTAASQAKSVASTSLNNNGSVLADVAITHALNKGSEQYTQAQVNAMQAIVDSLLGTGSGETATLGALDYIENALKYYIAAASIAPASTETTYETVQTTIMAASLADLKAGNVSVAVVSDNMKNIWIPKLEAAIATAEEANDKMPTTMSGGTYYTWNDVSPAMAPLINTAGLKINNMSVADVMADPGSVAGSIMKNGLNLTMESGSGVYADIADFCGNYSAGIIIPKLAYGTLEVEDVEANMKTEATNPTYLESAAAAVSNVFESSTGNGGANPLTDFYGYIIDLAFRTNAADSWLKIQPTAVDRIYADGSNTNTMGHGATMSFKTTSTTFTPAAVTRLMSAIRIVFFDTDSSEIITYARLDSANANTETDGTVTMPLALCTADGTAKGDDNIMKLKQNEVHELSVLVYLDGNNVQNDDVAADVANSMTGTMNLQFSSSATLVAMEYSDLKSGNGGALDGSGSGDDDDEPTVTTVTVSSVTGAKSATAAYGTYSGVSGVSAVITGNDDNAVTSGTVKINGVTAEYSPEASAWIAVIATKPDSVTIEVS